MELVHTLAAAPGCCATCQESRTPAIDTGRHDGSGFRVYICFVCIAGMATLTGWRRDQDIARERAELEAREARVQAGHAAMGEVYDELAELRAQHQALVRSIGYTLMKGAVVRQGQVALRLAPGVKKADLPEITG